MTEEERLVEEALHCADTGQAGHWPTAAGVLADEVRRLRAELAEMDEARLSALDLWRMSVHGVTSTRDLPRGAWSSS